MCSIKKDKLKTKTKSELIQEIETLLTRISELESSTRDEIKTIEQSKQKIEWLHKAARNIATCETEVEVYRTTVLEAREILNYTDCTLDIIEDNKFVVKAKIAQTFSKEEWTREMDIDEGIAGKTHKTGKTILITDLSKEANAKPSTKNIQSAISAPIGSLGIFQVISNKINAFSEEDVQMLELLLGHTAEKLNRIKLQKEIRNQAIHDPLTGVYNRHYLHKILKQEEKRSKRYSRSVAFIMIDLNGLKKVNDKYGHKIGDDLIHTVADLLLKEARQTDVVFRYGGDEFLIVLPETGEEVDIIKQRINIRVEQWNKLNPNALYRVSFALGSAYWSPKKTDATIEEIIALADKKMYENKRNLREIS
ncbi:MAG: GGDEF domain-containing protein [Candidatus Marinimicrobia bacterium]|nr:GGDEF domain-containing protein [Candidatus Neomarinimicrobiota bacterium]MBL7022436.1 GGDEF domain-containing protein [Candidatus Neomarinimicrobiota bacterium]MBL7108709.1 GGDEF domain-containing protein [Candidatus Neomarinimicrobiota bacterium]